MLRRFNMMTTNANPINAILAGQADPWGSDEDFLLSDSDLKESAGFIDVYSGPVTIISAQHVFTEPCKADEAFHKFLVTVENPDGAQRNLYYQVSFTKVKYGTKATTFPLLQIKKLFNALGFEAISATGGGNARSILRKYLDGWTEGGFLPKWKGLQFNAVFKYKAGTFYTGGNAGAFEVKDCDGKTAIFPQITVLDKLENKFVIRQNCPITGITRDEVKATAGQSGVVLKMSELVRLDGIEGVNNKILSSFSQQIKPSGVNDAHAQVSDDDVAF